PKPADVVTTATICSGETYTWTANEVQYTTSQTGTTITNDGCTANQILNLTVNQLIATKEEGTIFCKGGTTTVTITVAGGIAPYTNDGVHTVSAGAYSFDVTDTNCCKVTVSGTITDGDSTPPVISELPQTSTISCPATPQFATATATDNTETEVALTFVDVTTPGACEGSYSVTRTWTATDACGNTSTAAQSINVIDTIAPVIAVPQARLSISCPETPLFAEATATDACGIVASFTSVDVTTPGACAGSYSVKRTWTATDACGNSSTAYQTINVQDKTAPVIAALPGTSTIDCSASPAFAVATATDACGSVITLTSADVTTPGACAGSYSVTRTWTAADACGNASTASQTINVQDTTGPTTTTSFEPSIDVKCDAIPVKPDLVFVDGCSSVGTPVYTENIINQTADSYSIQREWNVSDACGNPSKFVQVVNVTVTNSVVAVASTACNTDSATLDLNSLLPTGTSANGIWTDIDNTGALQGSILSPLGISLGDYVFEYKISGGDCPLSIMVKMTVNNDCGGIVLGCGVVKVHNAFSPNGDSRNEVFIIDNIEDTVCYPDNTVEIYNRWGVLVFETKNYNNGTNVFDGTSQGRSTVSQSSGLPTGTYYYIVNYTSFDGNGKIQSNKKDGYLYLTR
ncbi:gliding motility-associated C-terminal domain-containing protein, partial [Flavobacterium sp. UBA4120]|uniref:gliding motility-associated C-terminal domain-containing protein n=3 Tax=Flavobacterium TaxID=237 RepID=UPI0025BDC415